MSLHHNAEGCTIARTLSGALQILKVGPVASLVSIMQQKKRSAEIALRTDNVIFPAILIASIFILAVLTFFPFLALGPILIVIQPFCNTLTFKFLQAGCSGPGSCLSKGIRECAEPDCDKKYG